MVAILISLQVRYNQQDVYMKYLHLLVTSVIHYPSLHTSIDLLQNRRMKSHFVDVMLPANLLQKQRLTSLQLDEASLALHSEPILHR
ncbi:hypothetical protein D3C77_381490 [compost metagenome]